VWHVDVPVAVCHRTEDDIHEQAPNTWTYLDAGHARWPPAPEMADRLEDAGIADARGFALNVSNYVTTADYDACGAEVVAHLPSPSRS